MSVGSGVIPLHVGKAQMSDQTHVIGPQVPVLA